MKTGNLNGVDLTSGGAGTNYLADDGQYKAVSGSQDLQSAYDNSTDPEILTDSSRNALTIKQGSGADTDNVLEVQNGAGTNTFEVNGNGDSSFAGTVDVNAQLTSNALFKSKGATIIEDSVFQVNKTSAPSITFNNSAGTSAYGLVGEQSGSINLDSYNGLDVELNSDNDVRIGATGDVNVTGNEINLNAPTNVDGSITLEGSFQQSVNNTAFNVISRTSTNPAFYVNNAHSGDIQVWQSDPTQTGQGAVARMYNDGSLDLGGVLNLESTTNGSPSTGDMWNDGIYITIQQNFKVRSDKPIFEMRSTKSGTWTIGERKGAINFYSDDGSGGGAGIHAFIQAQAASTAGEATDLSFGVTNSGGAATEGLRLKASGALNYRPITNASPEDGDIWRDSSDGKLKFRENGVTYNFN